MKHAQVIHANLCFFQHFVWSYGFGSHPEVAWFEESLDFHIMKIQNLGPNPRPDKWDIPAKWLRNTHPPRGDFYDEGVVRNQELRCELKVPGKWQHWKNPKKGAEGNISKNIFLPFWNGFSIFNVLSNHPGFLENALSASVGLEHGLRQHP